MCYKRRRESKERPSQSADHSNNPMLRDTSVNSIIVATPVEDMKE